MIERYAEFTQYPHVVEEGPLHTFTDPYHGDIILAWKGNYIWGAFDFPDGQRRSQYLTLVRENLDKLLQAR